MGEAVTAAKAEGLKETDALDAYIRLKDAQISDVAAKKAERATVRKYLLGTTASVFALIGLFSLILVLLAIERNTRPANEAAGAYL